jgi:hypothetical protein
MSSPNEDIELHEAAPDSSPTDGAEDVARALVAQWVEEEIEQTVFRRGSALAEASPEDDDRSTVVARKRQGPLPHAEEFERYVRAYEKSGEEIFRGANEHRAHTFKMDVFLAGSARLALVLTWSLCLAGIAVGLVLGLHGEAVLGGIFGVTGMTPAVVRMIRGAGQTGRP